MNGKRSYVLYAETALRFTVAEASTLQLKLEEGVAEIDGSELLINREYVFNASARATVFTWSGCKLILQGEAELEEVVRDSPMVLYINYHAAIEQMRRNSEVSADQGPSVLIVGPVDIGKSTMCRILLNYAVRLGRNPIFVDLDVGQGELSVPGTIGSLFVESQSDIEEGFMAQKPQVYHFGHKNPSSNITLYRYLISQVAKAVRARRRDYTTNVSGVIINTCGWIKGDGYLSITQAALEFEVDVVLVLGKESLYYQIIKDVPSFVKVVYVPRFKGVVERSREERFTSGENRISQYFCGYKKTLSPCTFKVKFNAIRIFKVLQPNEPIPQSVSNLSISGFIVVHLKPNFTLLNHLLCVTFSEEVDEETLRSNIAGFVCVTDVDRDTEEVTLFSPHPPPLPNVILLYSNTMLPKSLCGANSN